MTILPSQLSRIWTVLWTSLLSMLILILLPSCIGTRSSSFTSEKGLVPTGGPAQRPASIPHPLQRAEAAAPQGLLSTFHRFPLSFISNRGQVDEQVKFYGRSGSASIFFARDEVIYSFVQREKEASLRLRKVSRSTPYEGSLFQGERKGRGHVVRLQFMGANPDPVIEGREPLPGKANYFIGRDPARWKQGLPTYAQVRYRELWPGIDLLYHGQEGRLKYEFIVRPGADPAQIRLAYRGIEGLTLSDAGDLILKTASGELRDSRPIAYQEIGGRRVAVEADFRIEGRAGRSPAHPTAAEGSPQGSIRGLDLPSEGTSPGSPAFAHGFAVRGYDPSYPLILDPGLEYSTFLGGTGADEGLGIALDAAGNAYVTGWTNSNDFPATAGAFSTAYNGGNSDAFVAKLSADGKTLLYTTYLGGNGSVDFTGNDEGNGIAVDSSGNVYVTGTTESPDFPTTPGAFDTSYNGGAGDAFVAKLSADGSSLLFSTFLGGIGNEEGLGIALALDGSRNVFVTGSTDTLKSTNSSNGFPTTSVFGGPFEAAGYAFVARFSADGTSLLYSDALGGNSSTNVGLGIAVDAAGNAFVTGWTHQDGFPATPGAFDTSYNGGVSDAFVAKLSANGASLLYGTFLGGSDEQVGQGIAVNAAGIAFVTGWTRSPNFPTTPGAFDTSYNGGNSDAFVAKLSADGTSLLYSTFLGGSDDEEGLGIAVDAAGNAFVTGSTGSSSFPTTAGAFSTTYTGGVSDAFVAKVSADGTSLLYSTFLGGASVSGHEEGTGIAVDAAGNVFVTGSTISNDFPTTPGAFQPRMKNNSTEDAFVAKLSLPVVLQQFTLTVTKMGTGDGTVTSSPSSGIACGPDCSESYTSGTSITLAATPAGGSTFAGWRDACSGTGPCPLTMNSAKTAKAIFITPLKMMGSTTLEGEIGALYQNSLGIGGGLPPYIVSLMKGTLPGGLSLDSQGITGAPTKRVTKSPSFTVQVTDDLGSSVSQQFSFKIFQAVSITTISLKKGRLGKNYSAALNGKGGKKPYTWSLTSGSSLPGGMSLDPSTGKITGKPLASGNFNLTFQVTDALGGMASKTLPLIIIGP